MSITGPVRAIGALADPIRRRLYDYVARQREAVSRETAAEALSLPLTKARFHLDRLANDGLLDIEYRRMSGRQGPGAGRPSKLYRRAETEIRVSLPERRYDLMGDILAGAVVRNQQGEILQPAIAAVAHEKGRLAAIRVNAAIQADEDQGIVPTHRHTSTADLSLADQSQLDRADTLLTGLGYESEQCSAAPASAGPHDEELRLRNCPFEALAQEHRDLVCRTNQYFVQGVLVGAECGSLRADLEPQPGYCCVVVRDNEGVSPSEIREPGT